MAAETSSNWKNVNNWHWIEKDCTAWAHDRLKSMLAEARTADVIVTSVDSVEGEVSVNVRKGRIRQIFDLTMRLSLEADGEKREASIVDYMSDTDFAGFEFNCSGLPAASKDEAKKRLWDVLGQFRREVEETQGKPLLVKAGSGEAPTATESGPRSKFNGAFDDHAKRDSRGGETTLIEECIRMNAPQSEVWQCLTDPNRIAAWTRGTSQLNTFEPGASFTLLNGNILGTVTALTPPRNIKMDWRLKHWDSSRLSTVDIAVTEEEPQKTLIKLKQSGVPAMEADAVKENWHRYYWEPIKNLLGCSSSVF